MQHIMPKAFRGFCFCLEESVYSSFNRPTADSMNPHLKSILMGKADHLNQLTAAFFITTTGNRQTSATTAIRVFIIHPGSLGHWGSVSKYLDSCQPQPFVTETGMNAKLRYNLTKILKGTGSVFAKEVQPAHS